jgi:hypothetical protein
MFSQKREKGDVTFRRTAFLSMAAMRVIPSAGAAYGDIVNLGTGDLVTVDGTTYDLVSAKPTASGPALPDGAGLMWEWNAAASDWKACICRMVAFRALQAVWQYTSITKEHLA